MKRNRIFNNIWMKKILIIISLIIVVLTSGCLSGDDTYPIAEEQYAIGWILHNIDDSTETTLDYSYEELAVYEYSYNYPAYSPENYVNVFYWVPPMLKEGGGLAAAFGNELYVPLNRIYYVKGENPVPEHYKTSWSMANSMQINYLVGEDEDTSFAYDNAHEEHYKSENAFHAINPIPGDKDHIYFGTAPFIPTSFLIKNNVLRLKDHLMKGYNGKSYLIRNTEVTILDLITGKETTVRIATPKYQIYLDGELKEEGEIVDYYKQWDYSRFYYYLSSDGDYLVKLNIPTNYPVWNNTIITAKFTKPSSDINPPLLNRLDVSPSFGVNEPLSIKVNMYDDSSITDVKIYYKTNNDWTQLPVTSNYPLYTTSLTITDSSVEKIDLKFVATDTHNNEVSYEIYPISLKTRNIHLNFDETPDTALKGQTVRIKGTCVDDHGIICSKSVYGDLRAKYYMNGEFLKYAGIKGFEWNVPIDAPDRADFLVVVDEPTGVYVPTQKSFAIDIITPPAYLTDTYADYGLDTDDDGLYNHLTIEVGIGVNEAGKYVLTGNLYSLDGKFLDHASNYSYLNAGTQKMQLNFDGVKIRKNKLNGPYKLQYLYLYNSSWETLDSIKEAYTTSAYEYTEFQSMIDVFGYILWSRENLVVDQSIDITTYVENEGSEDAVDTTASLYEREWVDGEEVLKLIGTEYIGTLSPDERKQVNFTWIPTEVGHTYIKLIVDCKNDGNPENNEDYQWRKVVYKSMIKNTGTADLAGYFLMKVQKIDPIDETWKDYEVIVDDLKDDVLRTIPADSYLGLDTVWAEAGYFTPKEEGHFRVYAELRDRDGNVIETSDDDYFNATYEFRVYE